MPRSGISISFGPDCLRGGGKLPASASRSLRTIDSSKNSQLVISARTEFGSSVSAAIAAGAPTAAAARANEHGARALPKGRCGGVWCFGVHRRDYRAMSSRSDSIVTRRFGFKRLRLRKRG